MDTREVVLISQLPNVHVKRMNKIMDKYIMPKHLFFLMKSRYVRLKKSKNVMEKKMSKILS